MRIQNLIVWLQKLPEKKKSAAFFSIMGFVVLFLIIFTLISTKNNINKINSGIGAFKLPSFNFPEDTFESNIPKMNDILEENFPEMQENSQLIPDAQNLESENATGENMEAFFIDEN